MNPLVANIMLVLLVWSIPSTAQPARTDDPSLLRSQWESMAESVAVKIPPMAGRLRLIVETETDRSIIENSLLAALSRKEIDVTIGKAQSSDSVPILRISGIVSQTTPAVQTSYDVRWELANGTVSFLGHFEAEHSPRVGGAKGETVLERVFEPLVVIAGAVLVVYLFFTVRS